MNELSDDTIKQVLREVPVPGQKGDIISLKLLSGLVVRDGIVNISIETTPDQIEMMEGVRKNCEKAIRGVPGVQNVTAVLTEERKDAETQTANQTRDQKLGAEGVDKIIAIASGKGGVGKSTTAVNVAMALARLGNKVGIMDADIYGPSIPRMMGVDGHPSSIGENRLQPLQSYGVKCMSMGFLVGEDDPMIWRGSMVMSALEQMLNDVIWAPLDILIVDMPPGTGDAQLTLAQRTQLAGAVIISTPQDIALMDARRGINMFRKVHVPILGIIENMSHFICPECGKRSDIFSHGGARKLGNTFGIDFLGEIALDIGIRETSDNGRPIVISKASSPHAQAYMDIAKKLQDNLEKLNPLQKTPKIIID